MDPYADYEFYTKEYGGMAIPEKAFTRLATEASFFIDRITFGRVTEPIDEVKLATCKVAEVLHRIERNDGKSSESDGSVSVTYDLRTKNEVRLNKAAVPYLAGTGLLYRGLP